VGNPYYLPADEKEATRLDNLQYCVHVMNGHNILAPIRPSQVLDIGTGSGSISLLAVIIGQVDGRSKLPMIIPMLALLEWI
jgi:hypothetical protein